MKVRINEDLCEGYGTCASIAPDLFELDEWGYARGEHDVPAGREDVAKRAVLECPMNAITIED